jgi:glycogen debranching enzyme
MSDIVQEILTKHVNGIHVREWNAGEKVESGMRPEGFEVDVVTDWTNGFILGGNETNSGTWMDKMGNPRDSAGRSSPRLHRPP